MNKTSNKVIIIIAVVLSVAALLIVYFGIRTTLVKYFKDHSQPIYDVNDFVGTYYSGDQTALIRVDEEDTATVEIRQYIDDNEWITWIMHGYLDNKDATMHYSDCTKTDIKDEFIQSKYYARETLYSDGAGSIEFKIENDKPSFNWEDEKEDLDSTFTYTDSLVPDMVKGSWGVNKEAYLGETAASTIKLKEDGTALGYGISQQNYMPIPVFEGTWSIETDKVRIDFDGEPHYFIIETEEYAQFLKGDYGYIMYTLQ